MMKLVPILAGLTLASCARFAPEPERVYVPVPAPTVEPEVIASPEARLHPPSLAELYAHPDLTTVTPERAAYLRRENQPSRRYFLGLEIIEQDGIGVVSPLTKFELSQALPIGCRALRETGGDIAAASDGLQADARVRTKLQTRHHANLLLGLAVYYECPEYLENLNRYNLEIFGG